jgi:putative ABC transport system permease protein
MSASNTIVRTVAMFGQTMSTAVRALRRNLLRSLLTALGIIIGVASVIAMLAMGNGAQKSVQNQVAALGENLLTVFSGSRSSGGVKTGQGSANTLTVEDAQAILREVPDVVAMSPEVTTVAQAIANGTNWSTSIVGESPDYLFIRDWKLASGAMFSDRDVRAAAKVALIGAKTAEELFGAIDPLGKTVRIRNIPFVIVGVLTAKGSGMGGGNQDDRLIIPYTTAMRRLTGDRYLKSVNLRISSADRVDVAKTQIVALLRQRHRLPADRADDFDIFSQQEIAETVTKVTDTIRVLLAAVSGISLVVGGIGIMNIMLVSVTERTREIGLRMAVGAQPAAIRLQFLIEAVALSLLGGVIGVALGMGSSKLMAVAANFDAPVDSGAVGLAFLVSVSIGVFFGFYPAVKASNLDPIQALRFE